MGSSLVLALEREARTVKPTHDKLKLHLQRPHSVTLSENELPTLPDSLGISRDETLALRNTLRHGGPPELLYRGITHGVATAALLISKRERDRIEAKKSLLFRLVGRSTEPSAVEYVAKEVAYGLRARLRGLEQGAVGGAICEVSSILRTMYPYSLPGSEVEISKHGRRAVIGTASTVARDIATLPDDRVAALSQDERLYAKETLRAFLGSVEKFSSTNKKEFREMESAVVHFQAALYKLRD